jgi:NADH:ubiquinone oxidoreductase subunit 6 (subunit J)
MGGTGARRRGLGFASGVLWVLTGLLVAAAVVMIGMYGRFQEDSGRSCSEVADLEPPGGWSDASFPCEQFGPMAWYLPYWGAVTGCLVFAVLFLVAAVLTGRSHPRARGFALWTGIAAVVLLAVPVCWTSAGSSAGSARTRPTAWWPTGFTRRSRRGWRRCPRSCRRSWSSGW